MLCGSRLLVCERLVTVVEFDKRSGNASNSCTWLTRKVDYTAVTDITLFNVMCTFIFGTCHGVIVLMSYLPAWVLMHTKSKLSLTHGSHRVLLPGHVNADIKPCCAI